MGRLRLAAAGIEQTGAKDRVRGARSVVGSGGYEVKK